MQRVNIRPSKNVLRVGGAIVRSGLRTWIGVSNHAEELPKLSVDSQTTDFLAKQSGAHVTPFSFFNTVLAPHFSHQPKSHLLVDCNVRHHPRTFKVALPTLFIRPSHHNLHELLPYSLSLLSRQHSHNVAEIVALLVSPEFFLCFCLPCFPDPVPIYPQSATTEPADVE
jgi:hypothetical protein